MDFQRILLRFSKEGEASTLSHRDLMGLFERALRRAGLPVRMSQGFNPHPRMSILLALPVGVEADQEAIEIGFEPPVAPAEVQERLAAQLPKGIRLRTAEALPPGVRPTVAEVAYEAELPPSVEVTPADIEAFLARTEVVVERSTPKGHRRLDIRPAVAGMSLEGGRLSFRLVVGAEGTPRPDEVVGVLLARGAGDAPRVRLRRTELKLAIPSPRAHGPQAGHEGPGRTS